MADIGRQQSSVVWMDAPSLVPPVTAQVSNYTGIVYSGLANEVSAGRYSCLLSPEETEVDGVYTMTLTDSSSAVATKSFTVGDVSDGVSLWDLRIATASRQFIVLRGEVEPSVPGSIVDTDLVGGSGNYKGRFVMLYDRANTGNIGVIRRIVDFNGAALMMSSPFPAQVPSGTEYAMFIIDPREVDSAIRVACRELSNICRVDVTIPSLPVVNAEDGSMTVDVPEFVSHVHAVYAEDGKAIPHQLLSSMPHSRIRIASGTSSEYSLVYNPVREGQTVTVLGVRPLLMPAWDTSVLDVETSIVVAKASMELLASRSGGAGVDVGEHLRRQLIAQQEYDNALKRISRILPNGSIPMLR